MPKQAKKAAAVKEDSKVKIVKPDQRDGILYARIKPENVQYLKERAKTSGVSLSNYMDQVTDQLKGKVL